MQEGGIDTLPIQGEPNPLLTLAQRLRAYSETIQRDDPDSVICLNNGAEEAERLYRDPRNNKNGIVINSSFASAPKPGLPRRPVEFKPSHLLPLLNNLGFLTEGKTIEEAMALKETKRIDHPEGFTLTDEKREGANYTLGAEMNTGIFASEDFPGIECVLTKDRISWVARFRVKKPPTTSS